MITLCFIPQHSSITDVCSVMLGSVDCYCDSQNIIETLFQTYPLSEAYLIYMAFWELARLPSSGDQLSYRHFFVLLLTTVRIKVYGLLHFFLYWDFLTVIDSPFIRCIIVCHCISVPL
jgi:hypothetical protein